MRTFAGAPAVPANGPAAAPQGGGGALADPRDTGGQQATGRAGTRRGQRAPRGGESRRRGGGTGRVAAAAADRQDGANGLAAVPAGRRSGGRTKPSHRALILLLLAPVVIVILVVGAIVYRGSRPLSTASHEATAAASKPAVAPTTAPTPGPWRNITSQAVDTKPLSLHELYPARFSAGGSAGVKTVQRVNTKCTNAVIGSSLRTAARKGGCTQVMRASYLSPTKRSWPRSVC